MAEGFIIPVKTIGYKVPLTDLPQYTYTGSSTLIREDGGNWKIKFLTSGTLNFTVLNSARYVDIFAVGAGGQGGYSQGYLGGGGGYTVTSYQIPMQVNTNYAITIGQGQTNSDADGTKRADGQPSKFGNIVIANGGIGCYGGGGNGGSGGAGASGSAGTNGGNGTGNSAHPGGKGQGSTTREFGETNGTLYASGGPNTYGTPGSSNTGDGGGGHSAGGSGIVIIRNAR